MKIGDRQVSTSFVVDTKQAGDKRRRWTAAAKRELVAATLEPGSSVSIVARRHDVNADLLFKWRRLMLGAPSPATTLLPVAVVAEPAGASGRADAPSPRGRIEVILPGGVRVRIEGAADPGVVSAMLSTLAKARRRR